MVDLLVAALVAGLLGSLHCIGMCGAFAVSCSRVPGGLPAWHAGRVLTYGVLGGFAGGLGAVLPGPAWLPGALAALLLLWFSLALAGLAPEPRLLPPGLTRAGSRAAASQSPAAQFAFGVLNGFLPCGLVYGALTLAVAAAAPLPGALAMLAFGVGTLPALSLAAYGLRRLVLGSLWRRRLVAALILSTGLWTIWNRVHRAEHPVHQHHPTAPGSDPPKVSR